jgi:hypothetical protein
MKCEKKLMQQVEQLKLDGYKLALAIATEAEVKAGAACGQLSIITEHID